MFPLHLSKEISQTGDSQVDSWRLQTARECKCQWISSEAPRSGSMRRWGESCKSNYSTLVFNQVIHYHPEFSSKFRKIACGTEQL